MNSHKILARIHYYCYYYYYYKDLLRGSDVSSSVQIIFLHSLTIALVETRLQILFMNDETEAQKGYRGLAYATPSATLRAWI